MRTVGNSAYPPSWAQLALMQRYLAENKGPEADAADLAFRNFGKAALSQLQAMQSDLMPAWVNILQKE